MKRELISIEAITDYKRLLDFYNPNLHPNSRVQALVKLASILSKDYKKKSNVF